MAVVLPVPRPHLLRPFERKMVGNPNHGRLYYRCTASRDFVRQHKISHSPALYLREEAIIEPIDRFLREELTGGTLADNLNRVADAQYRAALTACDAPGEIEELRQAIADADADAKISRYGATLDAGGDPVLIAGWISEATAGRKAAQARRGLTEAPPQRMSGDQPDSIADAFNDLFRLLRDADPRDKAELYSRIVSYSFARAANRLRTPRGQRARRSRAVSPLRNVTRGSQQRRARRRAVLAIVREAPATEPLS